jgi:regulator of RNase E activity RraA
MEHPANQTSHTERFPWVTRRPMPARVARSVIERFEQMTDLSSTVSDVLDEMGIVGAVGSSRLRPSLPGGRVIGTAITVRNVEQRRSAFAAVTDREWRMAEILAVADAAPGDVLLIQGVHATSNMGGLLSTVAKREGVIGAVVDGGVRDLGHSRELGPDLVRRRESGHRQVAVHDRGDQRQCQRSRADRLGRRPGHSRRNRRLHHSARSRRGRARSLRGHCKARGRG